jgi:hypothetical protein
MIWFVQHSEKITLLLIVAAIILAIVNIGKYQGEIAFWLSANKDTLSALSTLLNIIVLIIGGFLAYLRFFRGRIFYSRAGLNPTVDVLGTPESFNSHAVTIEITNIGTLSIWDTRPVVVVTKYGPNG